MKCIHCEADTKYKERSDGRCPTCKRRFAFEPQKRDPITDYFMHRVVQHVSGAGRVKFNEGHVYYEVRRRLRQKTKAPILVSGLATFALTPFVAMGVAYRFPAPFIAMSPFLGGLYLISVVSLVLSLISDKRALPRVRFDALFARFVAAHGTPYGLIESRPEPVNPAPLPEELLSYSFDRAVICDRRETVDFLIANQFHFENNCALLGVDGYPRAAFEPIRRMLRNNPRLLVIALHDATPDGCRLAYRLRNDRAWFAGQAKVIDLGLRPAHSNSFPNMSDRRADQARLEPSPAFTAKEARWLASYSLALEVVRPEQLIKRLFRAIQEAERGSEPEPERYGESSCSTSSTSGELEVSSDSLSHDAEASDGGGDSFG